MAKSTRLLLKQMLDAYDQDDGADDRPEFIRIWASLIDAEHAEPDAPDYDVLVTGDPFDGLTVEGPYPSEFLGDCEINSEGTWWIVPLKKPTILDEHD
jgi:hypothetical protein